ncbi:MAG: hypothetical protein OEZ22_02770 [Spirochaetia bacterium]|nr:hypothetical protein [Spirochaetia bacterium]
MKKKKLYELLPYKETHNSQYELELKYKILSEEAVKLRKEISKCKNIMNLLEDELKEKEEEITNKEKTESNLIEETYKLEKKLEDIPKIVPIEKEEKEIKAEPVKISADIQVDFAEAEYVKTEEKILDESGKSESNYIK